MAQTSTSYPGTTYQPVERSDRHRRLGDLFKRLFDILVASVGMLLLSPVFLYVSLRIRCDSPGPALYHGRRSGRNAKAFQILKFRTMYETPQSYQGPPVTALGDERITRYGRWLRATKMNELPQFWNVLKGEMSLVGPRPEDPEIVAAWPEAVRAEILSVRPGITSPASILYRDEESRLAVSRVMDTYLDEILPSKLRLDQLYVRYRSFWGDLDILFWTCLVFLPRAKEYTPPEDKLFAGPVDRLVRRHISWFTADSLITLCAMGITGLFWRSLGPLDVGWLPAFILALGFAVLFSLTNVALGVNRIDWSRSSAADVLDLLPGVIIATLLALLFNLFYPSSWAAMLYGGAIPPWLTRPFLPAGLIVMGSVLALFGFVLLRYRSRLITGLATRWVGWRNAAPAAQERVLIIGCGETGRFAAWMLEQGRYANAFRVAGFVDDDLQKQDRRIQGVQVLGKCAQIPDLTLRYDIGIIVYAIHNISAVERRQLLEICHSTPARVVLFPDIPAALDGQSHQLEMALDRVQVDRWLAQLEATASSGDLEKLRHQIGELRNQMKDDAAIQAAAGLAGEEKSM